MPAILRLIKTFSTVLAVLHSTPKKDLCFSVGGVPFATLPGLSLLRRLFRLQNFISCSAVFEEGFP